MTVTVGINGFGRIGRCTLSHIAESARNDIQVVKINATGPIETNAHLLRYDSVHGRFPGEITTTNGQLDLGRGPIDVMSTYDPQELDWEGCDVVLECTGHANTPPIARSGLDAGAGQVLISGPSEAAEVTVVLGANDAAMGDAQIVSNGSCTTNALAPIMRILHDALHVEAAHMTTIHCYTGSQPTIDAPRGDMMRSRAAGLSMVPTTTSAQRLLNEVLPGIAGRIEAAAVRVPVASVSAVDLTVTLAKHVTLDDVHALFRAQTGVIGYTDKPLVSSDLRARPESLIVALPETRVTAGGLVRVFGWYDNEWGFSCRMLDVAQIMTT